VNWACAPSESQTGANLPGNPTGTLCFIPLTLYAFSDKGLEVIFGVFEAYPCRERRFEG
jgi:hypothetical protein